MVSDPADWRRDLEHWLEPFPARLSRPARRRMCPLSAAGLVGPGARKGIQPTARRRGLDGHDRPAHVVSAEAWDAAPLEAELVAQADRPVGGPDANRAIDDTALPTKGRPSVGVAPRSASAPGKSATRQTPVSMTRAKAGVPVPIALRLFLPESRTNDPARLDAAGVPEAWRAFRTEPAVAPAEIDRPIEAGLSVGIVPADAGSGPSAPFRQGLGARGLAWAVGIPRHRKVSPADVRLIFPAVGRGGPRERRVPDTPSVAAETMPNGGRSGGAPAPKASSAPASPRPGLAWPMARRGGSGMAGPGTRRVRRPGSSASTARRASGSTASRTRRPTRIRRRWPLSSRRAGCVSGRVSG